MHTHTHTDTTRESNKRARDLYWENCIKKLYLLFILLDYLLIHYHHQHNESSAKKKSTPNILVSGGIIHWIKNKNIKITLIERNALEIREFYFGETRKCLQFSLNLLINLIENKNEKIFYNGHSHSAFNTYNIHL